MAYNYEYPYTDPYRYNDDWILNYMKRFESLPAKIDTILKNMGINFTTWADFEFPEAYGAVGNGVSDDTMALLQACNSGKPILLWQKYALSNINITSKTVFVGGMVLCNGYVTFSRDIYADVSHIITVAGGECHISNGIAYPEWFGSERGLDCTKGLSDCINAINAGEIIFSGCDDANPYIISNTITLPHSFVKLSGNNAHIHFSATPAFRITGNVDSVSINDLFLRYIGNNMFPDTDIADSFAISMTGGVRCEINHVFLIDYSNGIYCKNTINALLKNITCVTEKAGGNTIYHYFIDSRNDNVAARSGNASIRVEKCLSNFYGSTAEFTYGFWIIGNDIRDIFLEGVECANNYNGITIIGENIVASQDVYIDNAVLDHIKNVGIQLSSVRNIRINNPFISTYGQTSRGINVYNSNDIVINAGEVEQTIAQSGSVGIIFENSTGTANSVIFTNCERGIWTIGESIVSIMQCVFTSIKNFFNNTFNGEYAAKLSSKCIVSNCLIDIQLGSYIDKAVVSTGGNNYFIYNISNIGSELMYEKSESDTVVGYGA